MIPHRYTHVWSMRSRRHTQKIRINSTCVWTKAIKSNERENGIDNWLSKAQHSANTTYTKININICFADTNTSTAIGRKNGRVQFVHGTETGFVCLFHRLIFYNFLRSLCVVDFVDPVLCMCVPRRGFPKMISGSKIESFLRWILVYIVWRQSVFCLAQLFGLVWNFSDGIPFHDCSYFAGNYSTSTYFKGFSKTSTVTKSIVNCPMVLLSKQYIHVFVWTVFHSFSKKCIQNAIRVNT